MTAPARHLTVVPGGFLDENGEVISPEVASLREEVAQLKQDVKNLENDIAGKRRVISELRRDKARERLDYARYDDVKRIATFWWRLICKSNPRVQPMSPERFDAVKGILEIKTFEVDERGKRRYAPVHELADFEQAIRGAHYDPYITRRKNGTEKRHDDLSLICRDQTRFREFMAKAPRRPKPFVAAGRDLLWRA